MYDPERIKSATGIIDMSPHSDYDCKTNCGDKPE